MSSGTTCRLGESGMAELILGSSPPSTSYNQIGEGLPFYQGKVDFGLISPTTRVWCRDGIQFADRGDVLVSVRAPVGDVNMATDRCVIGRGIAALRAGPGTNPWFLFFAMQHVQPVLMQRSSGSTFASVNKSTLQDLEMPVFSVVEQADIARVLSYVLSCQQREDSVLVQARDIRLAAMRELFTRGLRGEPQRETEIGLIPSSWDLVHFADAREWLQYGTSNRCTVDPVGYPVLRIPNIEPGRVNAGDLKYCELTDNEAAKYLLVDGDLLFIRTNGVLDRLGSCAVYAGQPEHALFASYLIRARPKPGIVPRFVAYFYGSARGTSLVAGSATPAADGKYNLNTGTIDSLPLPLPKTRQEQQEIVDILDAIDQKIDLHKRKKVVLEELFKSLLQKLMTGEIRVADLDLSVLPVPEEART